MDRRIVKNALVLWIAIFIGFGICLNSSLTQADEEVTVGVILPLSGPLSTIGQTCKQGLDFAAKGVNNGGGIKSMGGAKIKLLYADSRGDPKIGMSEAERLIMKDNVSTLMGAYQSGVTLPATQVAERYKVPFVTVIAVADSITERGLKYVFRINEKADWTGKDIFKFLVAMGEKTKKPVKTLGLLYENTEWGQSSAKSWHKYAKEAGFQVSIDEPYPHGTTDMTPVVIKFKQSNPDAVINASYISDMILLIKTMAENKYMPKAFVSSGGGEVQPEFMKEVGDQAEYIFSAVPWVPDLYKVKPWAKKIGDDFEKEYRAPLSVNAVNPYATVYVLADALERAGSKDREKIREALAATNLSTGNAMILPSEKYKFEADGQNYSTRLLVTQIQKKSLRIVYPFDLVAPDVKVAWPIPSWQERK